MSEMILSVKTLPEILLEMIPTERVKLRQSDGIISLVPLREITQAEECPLRGLTAGSSLTVEKFLEMTREDRVLEGLDE